MTRNNYMICSTVRSGSTLLCKTLETLDGFGHPEEYFHRHRLKTLTLNDSADDFLQYCHSIFTQDTLNRFGSKMHWWQLIDFLALARQLPKFREKEDLDILNTIFPNLRFIYLRRRNVVSQAISAAIASQTGQWEKGSHSKPSKPVKFQPWKIYEWERSLNEQNHCWQMFFHNNGLDYFEITYEELVDSFSKGITNVINYIDDEQNQPATSLTMPTQQQSNVTNQRFAIYYKLIPKPLNYSLYRLYRQLKPVPYGEAS
ncbi:MAG: hypothetical protein F6K11_21225 [Leptolyngbya sp. SIO3F4]|nr:hypothetical protein [Leptolyngbya sp. SIO3F4]